MKGVCLLLVLSFVLPVVSFGQDDTPAKVHIIGRAEEKSVVLRIAPGSPALWELGNKHGYTIERFTVTRDKKYLGSSEREILTPTPIKPLPMSEWEAMSLNNAFAEIAVEAIYGETFELSTDFGQDVMQLYNKAKELESRFSFALFCADVSAEVAQASGLYFKDADVKKNERYLYRVYSNVPQTLIKSDTGFVYLSLENYAPLPEIKDVKIQFSDRLAMISWNTRYAQSFYSAYWIERSEDGKKFERTSELPYVNTYPDDMPDAGISYKIDSLKQNNTMYYYRIIGISLFGETGPPSEIVKGEGVEALGVTAAIRKIVKVGTGANLQWEFPKEKESAILGFEVERSHLHDKSFIKNFRIACTFDQKFLDPHPEGTNYYRVKALGKNNQKSFSFPVLYQLEDSIPPVQPTGLTGIIDTTGKVVLHWNKNTEPDLLGYRIFRSNFQSAEFSQITSAPVDTAEFIEKIPLQNLSRAIYYKVQAIDTRFNPSGYSTTIKLFKPDVVPPVAPVIKEWKAGLGELLVAWAPSSSNDVSMHRVKIKTMSENKWTLTRTFLKKDTLRHNYSNLKTGNYEVMIEAIDSSGNVTGSKPLRVNIVGIPAKAMENIKATVDRTNKKIILTWKSSEEQSEKILVYRAVGDGKPTLYKTIHGSLRQFSDDQLVINETYSYYLKKVEKNGEEGFFSEKVVVKF